MQPPLTESDQRRILEIYVNRYGFIRHQIESFNHFIVTDLTNIVKENSTFEISSDKCKQRHVFCFQDVILRKPIFRESDGRTHSLYPSEARLRGLTYSNPILVNVSHKIYQWTATPEDQTLQQHRCYREILLCEIPTMVRSRSCHLCHTTSLDAPNDGSGGKLSLHTSSDIGGYFIVNGKEKVIVCQEKLRTNFPYVHSCNSGRYPYYCEVRSLNEAKRRSTSTLKIYITKRRGGSPPQIIVNVPFLKCPIALAGIFRILGVDKLSDMVNLLVGTDSSSPYAPYRHLAQNVVHSTDCTAILPRPNLIDWIGQHGTTHVTRQRRSNYVEHIFQNEFLPHMGLDASPSVVRGKLFFLCYSIRKLLLVSSQALKEDDRDDYYTKVFHPSGMLIGLLFRQLYRNNLKNINRTLQRCLDQGKYINVLDSIGKNITVALKYALSTGNWGIQKSTMGQSGVAQVLSRLNWIATLSHLRRVNKPLNREGKIAKPRQLHRSHWGILCCTETPEGAPCGLVKNLSMLCHIRVGYPSATLVDWILDTGITGLADCSSDDVVAGPLVLLNGVIMGVIADGDAFVARLRHLRQYEDIPFDVSIHYDKKWQSIQICSDAGGCCRPLLVVTRLAATKEILDQGCPDTWSMLLHAGCIVYVEKQEESVMVVANTIEQLQRSSTAADRRYSHLEIHPSVIQGICASLIPFAEHNQTPRDIYGSCMAKQSIGHPVLYATNRVDTISHHLWYPQKPMITTQTYDLLDLEKTPDGTNCIVAIMAYTGFNQEDSIIINEQSMQRGLFAHYVFRSYRDEQRTEGSDAEIFQRPPADCLNRKDASYDQVGEDGMPFINGVVQPGDVIIGKCVKTTTLGESNRKMILRDRSTMAKGNEPASVDSVYMYQNKDGRRSVVVKTRARRGPIIGDKLSSHHGQKGVVGMVLPQVDMPFTHDGLCPDLIINTHCVGPDTVIRLANGQVKQIKDIWGAHDVCITTLNPDTLKAQTTFFVDGFVRRAPTILTLTTTSGRTITCTKEHEFLVLEDEHVRWKEAQNISPYRDKILVMHSVSPLPSDDGATLILTLDANTACHDRLRELGFHGKQSWDRTCILARFLGALDNPCAPMESDELLFLVDEPLDCADICRDLTSLGFLYLAAPNRGVIPEKSLGTLLRLLSGPDNTFPSWLLGSSSSVKREFLSTRGSCLKPNFPENECGANIHAERAVLYLDRNRVKILPVAVRNPDPDEPYLSALHALYKDLNIRTTRREGLLEFDQRAENIDRIMDLLDYRYGVSRARSSRQLIEFHKCTSRSCHTDFLAFKEMFAVGEWASCHLETCEETATESMVYDFTTVSPNHSFIANGFISHNCLPSRMTIAQLMEMLFGPIADRIPSDIPQDGTAFVNPSVEQISKALLKNGMDGMGNHTMYDGRTGEMLAGRIFMGPVHYLALKHQVLDKVHARSRGPRTLVTHQPVEGRSKGGALRFGEMERDGVITHGACNVLRDRLMFQSDPCEVSVCSICGFFAEPAPPAFSRRVLRDPYCRNCRTSRGIKKVWIPYAFKLLHQETMAMHIGMRLHVEEDKERVDRLSPSN